MFNQAQAGIDYCGYCKCGYDEQGNCSCDGHGGTPGNEGTCGYCHQEIFDSECGCDGFGNSKDAREDDDEELTYDDGTPYDPDAYKREPRVRTPRMERTPRPQKTR